MQTKIDPAKTKLLKEFKQKGGALVGGRIDPTGRFVFAGCQNNTIQRWEIATGKNTPLAGHRTWVRAFAFSKDGKTLFSGDWTGKILAWPADAEKPTPRFTIDAHPPREWCRALAVSPDGTTLASVGNDHRVCLWNTADGKPKKAWVGHDSHIYNVLWTPDGKRLVTADLKGVVKDWDLAKGTVARTLDAAVLYKYDQGFMADIGGVRSMALSADGTMLACAGITNVSNAFAGVGNPAVVLFDFKTGKRKHLLKPKAAFQGTMWGVAFHPAGYILATAGGNGGMLWFWKPDADTSVHQLKLPNNARDLSLSPDGKLAAIPFYDGAVRLYSLGT
jgi:WD40 repeat protein